MASSLADALISGFNGYKRYLMHQFKSISEYDAEDIIQQTAMKFIYKGNDIQAIDQFVAYIKRSLSNTAKDYFKKQSREVPVETLEKPETKTTETPVLLSEAKEELRAAILRLDEKSRYVLVETVLKGRSFKALSEETGEPVGTLLSRKNRAVKKLKAEFDDYMKE